MRTKAGLISISMMALLALFSVPAARAQTLSSPDFPAGTLQVVGGEGETRQFPLKHTSVKSKISGYVAETEVRQEYINPFQTPIEAVYVFPLPHDAAVYDMEMRVGDRVVKGEIKRREEAKQIYEQAKQEGKRASLLEQERPNIFTQSVANIMPGDQITIVIRYTETLVFDKDRYRFVFPMVVGPRYIPGDWMEDNFIPGVTDFERITPPVLEPGTRSGHDIDLTVELDTGGIAITELKCGSHQIDVTPSSDSAAKVSIRPGDTVPNKDFVLEYVLSSDRPRVALFTHRPSADEDGYFNLMIQPQTDFPISKVTPKEVFFLVDASGSMTGEPIDKMKEAMRYALKNLNPDDAFYIAVFHDWMERLSDRPLLMTPDNLVTSLKFIDGLEAGGGTEMLPGIQEVLRLPRDEARLRIIVVMTDGYIGNEHQILDAVDKELGNGGRLFSFGIGSSPNRYLIDNLARTGRGAAYYVNLNDKEADPVKEFYDRIRSPLLTDIAIDWGGVEVSEIYPARIPDLFAGQPLYLHGRYKPPGAASTVKVSGRSAEVAGGLAAFLPKLAGTGAPVSRLDELLSVESGWPASETENTWIGRMWARAKITDLTDQMFDGEKPDLVEGVTLLGLRHRLMTKYTSFVAVEETPATTPGVEPQRVEVPLELPAGTVYEGFFGAAGGAESLGGVAMMKSTAAPASLGLNYAAPIGLGIGTGMAFGGSRGFVSSAADAFMDIGPTMIGPIFLLPILATLVSLLFWGVLRLVQRKREKKTGFGKVMFWSFLLLYASAMALGMLYGHLEFSEMAAGALAMAVITLGFFAPVIFGYGVRALVRLIQKKRGKTPKGRVAMVIATVIGYLALPTGLIALVARGGEAFGLMAIVRNFVAGYAPPTVAAVLLFLALIRVLTWKRAAALALGIMAVWYGYRLYAMIAAVISAPQLFPPAWLVTDPRAIASIIMLAGAIVAVLGVWRGWRWGMIVAAVVSALALIGLVMRGLWPLTAAGWPLLAVVPAVSLIVMLAASRKPVAPPPAEVGA